MIVTIEKLTIKHLVQRSFSLYHSLPCLAFFDEKPITYAEVQNQVYQLSSKLVALGIQKATASVYWETTAPTGPFLIWL